MAWRQALAALEQGPRQLQLIHLTQQRPPHVTRRAFMRSEPQTPVLKLIRLPLDALGPLGGESVSARDTYPPARAAGNDRELPHS
jgi:hypothetical protein